MLCDNGKNWKDQFHLFIMWNSTMELSGKQFRLKENVNISIISYPPHTFSNPPLSVLQSVGEILKTATFTVVEGTLLLRNVDWGLSGCTSQLTVSMLSKVITWLINLLTFTDTQQHCHCKGVKQQQRYSRCTIIFADRQDGNMSRAQCSSSGSTEGQQRVLEIFFTKLEWGEVTWGHLGQITCCFILKGSTRKKQYT